jgi:hypothetical protein
MAVFEDSTARGGVSSTDLGTLVADSCDWAVAGGDIAILAGISFSATDLRILGIPLNDNSLTDLQRTITYRGIDMVSLGVQQWGTAQVWTEVFGLIGVDPGPGTLDAQVYGGGASQRWMRFGAQSWSGVDSIGAPTMATGTGTSMSISSTVAANGRLAGIYGSRSGISGMSAGSPLYLQNSGIGLLIGDVVGTGTTQAVVATQQQSSAWGGMVVPLQAADTIATCELLDVEPVDIAPVVRARQRVGGLRRNVYPVPVTS